MQSSKLSLSCFPFRMLLKAWLRPLKSHLLLSDTVMTVGRLERRLIFSQTGKWVSYPFFNGLQHLLVGQGSCVHNIS